MRKREYVGLILPSVVVMFGFLVLPLYRTIEWSLEKVDYGSPGDFIGLQNYTTALTDPRFGRAVLFTVGLTLVVSGAIVVGGYILATLVDRLTLTRPLVLGLLLVSYVIPHVVGATMFSWLFDENFGGVANQLVSAVTGSEVLWFTETIPNRIMVGMNVIWSMLPFAMLIIMAGLQGVPEEVIEASKIDGASAWSRHWHIIIPTIRGVLGFVGLISIMDVLRVFDNLVPLSPQAETIGNETIMMYIYNMAFRDGGLNLGLGSAISVLTILLILIMLFPFIRDIVREGRHA